MKETKTKPLAEDEAFVIYDTGTGTYRSTDSDPWTDKLNRAKTYRSEKQARNIIARDILPGTKDGPVVLRRVKIALLD